MKVFLEGHNSTRIKGRKMRVTPFWKLKIRWMSETSQGEVELTWQTQANQNLSQQWGKLPIKPTYIAEDRKDIRNQQHQYQQMWVNLGLKTGRLRLLYQHKSHTRPTLTLHPLCIPSLHFKYLKYLNAITHFCMPFKLPLR